MLHHQTPIITRQTALTAGFVGYGESLMDINEAKILLENTLRLFRDKPYSILSSMIDREPDISEVTGESGTKYQIEIQIFWDDKPFNNIRVLGSIDDGGFRAFSPLSDDFIISPSGEFICE